MMNKILSCDWGTTSFRLRLIDVDTAKVLHEIKSFDGVNAIHDKWLATKKNESVRLNFYRNFIQSQIEKLNVDVSDVTIIISGMASSTIGMKELTYAKLPFKLSVVNLNIEKFEADNFCKNDILLVSGLQTGVDVMRGEETLLLGCDIKNDVLVIFPGTHSKHVVVKNKTVIDFKTYMTGEFFNLLSTQSLLAKSVSTNNEAHEDAFIKGVKDGAANNVLNAAFHVRTNQLFQQFSSAENYHYLSGLLIGNELSELLKSNQRNIVLICADNLLNQYTSALNIINQNQFNIQIVNADDALIKAHIYLYSHYRKTTL
ncbi:MAG: 2-dehydro-3-deoxygalactonokinase [Parafilimonas sp.]